MMNVGKINSDDINESIMILKLLVLKMEELTGTSTTNHDRTNPKYRSLLQAQLIEDRWQRQTCEDVRKGSEG